MKLSSNLALNGLSTLLNLGFPLITLPLVARALGPQALGTVNYIVALITSFMTFSGVGVTTYAIVSIPKLGADRQARAKLFYELVCLQVLGAAGSWAAFQVLVSFNSLATSHMLLFQVAGLNIIGSAVSCEWFYVGEQNFLFMALRNVAIKLTVVIAIVMLVHKPEDSLKYIWIMSFGWSGSQVINFLYAVRRLPRPNSRLRPLQHLRVLTGFAPLQFSTTLQKGLDKIIVGYFLSPYLLAFYTLASRLCSVGISLVTAATGVLLPRLSGYIGEGRVEQMRAEVANTFVSFVPVAVLLILEYAATGNRWIVVLFGSRYAPTGAVLKIIQWNMILYLLTQLVGNLILLPTGRQTLYLFSVLCGVGVEVISVSVGATFGSAAGAALGATFASLVTLGALTAVARSDLFGMARGLLRSPDTWRRLTCALPVIGVVQLFDPWIPRSAWGAITDSALILTTYLCALIISGDRTVQRLAGRIWLNVISG